MRFLLKLIILALLLAGCAAEISSDGSRHGASDLSNDGSCLSSWDCELGYFCEEGKCVQGRP